MNNFSSKQKTEHPLRNKEQRTSQTRMISKRLIDKICSLRDEMGVLLVEKFSIESILSNIEKHQIQIVELFSKYLRDGFNLLQFIRFFLNIIPHHQIENLYLTIGLIDLFREITLESHKEKVILKDITDFMCEKILKSEGSFNKIEAKFIPYNQFFRPSEERKQFLQLPPTIYGESDQKIYKLCPKCIKMDSSKHSRAIVKSQFCQEFKKIFILDSLSDSIAVYDENCCLLKRISPTLNKLKKEVIILSFAFSRRQYRVGAVLKDFSIKFWDHFNNFQYEKSISTTSICQNLQTNIYFLEYFNSWITTDKTGTIHFWNLLEERPDRSMKCKYNAQINDICEIPSLNLLVVVQECKRSSRLLIETQEKGWDNLNAEATVVIYNYYNGHIITEIDLQGMRIPHTIIYSEIYQVLFMCGLEKKIRIYDMHPIYMDASLKGQLIGHENLITCFSLINGTPMLVSADDKGKVKLWDFRNFMCLQTIDFSDKTVITNLLDMVDMGMIGVFGSRVNYIEFEDRYNLIKKRNDEQHLKVESIDFDVNTMEMFVFSTKALRVIDLYKGQIKHIFSFKRSPSEKEFTAFRYFSCQKKFVLGSSSGEISIFSAVTGQVQSVLKEHHEGAVSFIQLDEFNKLYITVGYDSKILIHRLSDGSMVRELKNNFNGKEINCMEISVYHNLIAIGSNSSSSVYFWNYEFGKLVGEIQLQAETPVALHFINGYGLLVVGTNLGKIYVFRTMLTSTDLELELIDSTSIDKNILTIYSDLKLLGKGKQTVCELCNLQIVCEGGQIFEFDFISCLKREPFRFHCKDKSSYNAYRQGKENFASELQKMKHTVFQMSLQETEEKRDQELQNPTVWMAELSSVNLCRLLKLQHSYHLMVGNDRRIKLWDRWHQLLCDVNISYCLPYKWDLKPTSKTIMTEKIFYGIKVLQSIIKKYQNDISIGQVKNLQIKQLFSFFDKADTDKQSVTKIKMITQPDEMFSSTAKLQEKQKQITLLQNEYSKKDLNFQLVKRFNFTEVAGPTLKELDNIKKIQSLQREWKIKEIKQEEEKEGLMKSIESKAKKNQEKDYIQFLFVKPKKVVPKEQKTENEKITNLTKKLNAVENKAVDEKKPHLTTFYKSIYNRFAAKMGGDTRATSEKKLDSQKYRRLSRVKQSFEDYYKEKFGKQASTEAGEKENVRFRDILTQMNGRVNSIKKYRYHRGQSSKKVDQ